MLNYNFYTATSQFACLSVVEQHAAELASSLTNLGWKHSHSTLKTEERLKLACVGSVNSRLLCMLCCCGLLSLEALALSLFQLPVESRDMALQLVVGGSQVSYDASIANLLGLAGSLRGLKLLLQLQQLPHLAQNENSVHGLGEV